MAEVLSPPMQPTSTITMLHPRPSSADAFQGSQQQYTPTQRLGPAARSMYHGQNNTYRGASAPVQPYAFQSTPNLRQDGRTNSVSAASHGPIGSHRQTASTSTNSSDASSQPSAKDDSVIGSRPASMINLSSQIPDLSLTAFDQPVKSSPDRYRRPNQKRNDSSNVPQKAPSPQPGSGASPTITAQQPMQRQTSVDDMALPKPNQSELAKRYRRRSLNQLDTSNMMNSPPLHAGPGAQRPFSGHGPSATSTPTSIRPVSFHQQEEALPVLASYAAAAKSELSKDKDRAVESVKATPAPAARSEQKVNVPPRGSSEPTKRLAAPSPLSRQASEADSQPPSVTPSPTKPRTYAAVAQAAVATPSPAAQQLAAVSDKDLNKGMKSRLRRAFSFGSAQELKKASGDTNQVASQQASKTKQQHQQQIDDELDAEQLEIARRQEEAGIGAGIYSGQGGFSGSTDNLSISSTASSASMMLRKMGRGAKKSAKSIKGRLFRPKSVIGVPAADGPIDVGASTTVQPTVAQVSMVTVEAERLNVNVNAHPDELVGGGTGFPKLERNSMDAANATGGAERQRGSADGSDSRRSIVGSDKDRAEVLAAVKKGILKRSGTNSPNGSPTIRPNEASLAPAPHITESPVPSTPSTPKDVPQGRSSSAPNVNGDYFSTRMGTAKSMPNTPNGSVRSITFSPRIQFHDVWSSQEYDRRGEIATCNRLTPMLAQQIKEELNTFKMEMEVHELSKPHTHFF